MITFWIDMDGVLAKYHRKDYKCADPKFLHYGEHYFRTLEPIQKMVDAVKELDAECKNTSKINDVSTRVATNTNNISNLTGIHYVNNFLLEEHIQDKLAWLHEYLPCLDTDTQFAPTTDNKPVQAMLFKGKALTANDILIDDFNKNLFDWEAYSGTPIKFLNGTNNSKTFSGEKLPRKFTSNECLEYLKALIDANIETELETIEEDNEEED